MPSKTPSENPNKRDKDDNKSLKDKFNDHLESFKKSEKMEEIYNYATNNIRDTIAYILMIAGLILMMFEPSWYGATLVGVIFGLYFSDSIIQRIRNFDLFVEKNGLVRVLILAGTLLAFFIASPFIFIGAAVAIAVKQFFAEEH